MVPFPEKGNIGRGRIGLEGERMSLVLNEFAVGIELSSSQSDMCLMLIREVWATAQVCKPLTHGCRLECCDLLGRVRRGMSQK